MTHEPLCPIGQTCTIGSRDGFHVLYEVREGLIACDCCDRTCGCDLIAKVRADELRHPSEDGWMSVRAVLAWEDQVRADERAKYVPPDLPRGGEHVDYCRDLACYGCVEVTE